ncbi:heavy metal translocating P-type ATPase [Desulforhopalus singaporensis]|uniref:P-type Cu(2+) transporter n=1 Tax=Desulforhopalus singaporensis TaxID=91360 RepID=A0A1H0J2U3_9BACT|nr:heavy metal translocating P-type ATPase [Desulforhopalus singaporensis]SDO37912.1 Cu+-exporting ATPase [Desulforhopalus singaporensis]
MHKSIKVNITGMHCAACSSRIERVVSNMEGVDQCSVNLATQKALIAFDPALTSVTTIADRISGLGFHAEEAAEQDHGQKLEEAGSELLRIKARLLPEFVLAITIMVLSMGPMVGLQLPRIFDPDLAPLRYGLVQFLLVLPVLYLGRNFYLNGLPALFRGVPNMDSLIAIGTGAAFVYSTWNLVEIAVIGDVHLAHDLYYEAAAMLIALVSLGKYLEARSKFKTTGAIRGLMELAPDRAILLVGEKQKVVAVTDIRVGDRILIRPGERIPVDSVVVEGNSVVDESMLTGESMPVGKKADAKVYCGTLNKNGTLILKATKVGHDTVLARIIQLVQDAQGAKAPIAGLADRISLYFVPAVIAIGLVAGISWFFIGGADFSFSLRIFIAVLVIACPCAMGLATPTSIMVGTGRGAQLGILVKTGEVLERAKNVGCMVFDKTGTLTTGKPEITDIALYSDLSEEMVLRLAAGAESRSEHPIGQAILTTVAEKNYEPAAVKSFLALPGKGIEASLLVQNDSYELLLGNHSLLQEKNVSGVTQAATHQAAELSHQGKTVLYLAVNGKFCATLAVADRLKEEAAAIVARLDALGIHTVMLTGDNEETAGAVARQSGISEVIAGVFPENKAEQVRRLQLKGYVVAMVGDGINDAPALAQADVGIAMGTGIDVAMESADIVLMGGRLEGVLSAIGLSRATLKNIYQNLFWAFGYNVIGIPVAAGVLALFGGPTLNPMIGGAAMALSSVSVVSNALRLRFYQPEKRYRV